MPYAGDYRTAGVIQAAYLLNAPLAAVVVQPCAGVNESASDAFSFVSVDVPDVIVETIKAAEDGDGIILRAYEAYNQTAKATLSFGFPLKSACLCDLLENDLSPVPCANNAVALTFKPYEIHTLRVFADSQKSAAPPRKPARRPTKE
jgi:alpha-mannosidase